MEVDNSESPSTSGTSTPAIPDAGQQSASGKRFDNSLHKDNGLILWFRFDYLLKQTELFSHFMGGNKATSPLKVKAGRKKKVPEGKVGDSRHRMTEQEEDEELLSDLNQAKTNVIQFDESPAYIKVRIMITIYD